ncbi:MAG: hypothetical protein EOP09_02220 [Proteobacteria bacterium]|nr:MAG: hypothetical protein EOP09_02220 [Pseudomonadota bacterium]
MMNRTATLLAITSGVLCFQLSAQAWATDLSGDKGNGGDVCENRIQVIKNDLKDWISKGGSSGLRLPLEIPIEKYNQVMTQQIGNTVVACTEETILVGASEKTCKNFVDDNGKARLLCNLQRFMATNESDQYVLVHHEYAGLGEIEKGNGEVSNYEISNQISAFLQNQVVKKLVVATGKYVPSGRAKVFKGPEGEILTAIPLNNNTKVLIYTQNTYGYNNENVLVYDGCGNTSREIEACFPSPQRADRADRTQHLVFRFYKDWLYDDYLIPKPGEWFPTRTITFFYSEELSAQVDVPKLLRRAKEYRYQF